MSMYDWPGPGAVFGAAAALAAILGIFAVAVWALAEAVQMLGGGVLAGTATGACVVALLAIACASSDESGRRG